jgi:hypothetical protein
VVPGAEVAPRETRPSPSRASKHDATPVALADAPDAITDLDQHRTGGRIALIP